MLRSQFFFALVLTLVIATTYFYTAYSAVCPLPLAYNLAVVDERFVLDRDAATTAVADATAVWEDALGQDIFLPTEQLSEADFTVNFLFDDRQARTDAEARARERLAVVEALSGEVQSVYQTKLDELETREVAYEARAATYEQDLVRYNATVAEYNAEGGAPEDVFGELEQERERLASEADALNQEIAALNQLVDELNQLGAEANLLVSRYNERVENFNDTFADGREFTQGDWQGDRINIYSFADQDELHVVLVHELGHALGLEHVPDETAFMHYLLGEQDAAGGLRPDDVAAFAAMCSIDARLATVPQPWRTVFAWLGV
ncbi:hypothetical protein CL655_01225 [bacterium]|nr:hypothetical protein [bacterium]|tara:strand:- start:2220 stop:3179 length:960 start_codon:yes stop_codon:yes gene_type:complete